MISVLYVFLGGGLGSISRYGIGQVLQNTHIPIGTLTANIISSLILGYLLGANDTTLLKSESRLFLMTGFCGGFSTFSTFSGELYAQLQSDQVLPAILYLILSIVSGVLAIAVGWYAAKSLSV